MSATHPHRVVPRPVGGRGGPTVPRRVLVVAVDAVVPGGLARADVVVVAPAFNTRVRHWVSDEDAARRRADERLGALVERLRPIAAHVEGRVGDADPLLAIGDALATFPADEIVVAAGSEHTAAWAEALAARARERFAVPVFRAGGPHAVAA